MGNQRLRKRLVRPRVGKPGAPPGTLTIHPDARAPVMRVLAYGEADFTEQTIQNPADAAKFRDRYPVTWLNVDGLGDAATLAALGETFGLHRLALEDVVNVHQRPKVEEYEDHYFVVMRQPRTSEGPETEQLSLFLGKDYVLTLQEDPGDCFESVRDRIRQGRGKIRPSGSDYLAYALLDAVVDAYFPLLERYGDRLGTIEEEILGRRWKRSTVPRLHEVRRDLMSIRRVIWPLREALAYFLREHSHLVSKRTRVYFRDSHDHAVQIVDLVDTYRDFSTSLMDLHLTFLSHRMGEVMKVLTMLSAVFIPLTFIVGIYGMNFNTEVSRWNMPELNWRWGYPVVMAIMLAIGILMVIYFLRKGWIGEKQGDKDSEHPLSRYDSER